MDIQIDRHGLLILVRSILPFYSLDTISRLINEKKVYQTGNQHNEDFQWSETYLSSLTDNHLYLLYKLNREEQIKNKQNKI